MFNLPISHSPQIKLRWFSHLIRLLITQVHLLPLLYQLTLIDQKLPTFLTQKFDVMYGISECLQNLSRQTRQQTDLDSILKVFSDTEVGTDYSSIKHFFVLEILIQGVILNALVQFR